MYFFTQPVLISITLIVNLPYHNASVFLRRIIGYFILKVYSGRKLIRISTDHNNRVAAKSRTHLVEPAIITSHLFFYRHNIFRVLAKRIIYNYENIVNESSWNNGLFDGHIANCFSLAF